MSRHAILVLESNDWDREQIRTFLRELSVPVRIVNGSTAEKSKTRIWH